MKVVISFICGAVACALIILAVKPVLPAMADTADDGTSSDNRSFLADLLPDVEKIYRESLTAPFIKAESKIYDPDIAAYYRDLMKNTGLTDPSSK